MLLHNHPNGASPSWTDIETVVGNGRIRGSVITCRDGTLWEIARENPEVIEVFGKFSDITRADNPDISNRRSIEDAAFRMAVAENEERR